MTKASLTLRIIYALCLAGATFVHVSIHIQYGLLLGALEAQGYPLATRMFWSALTLLDPLAVLLLFIRPRVGLVLASVIADDGGGLTTLLIVSAASLVLALLAARRLPGLVAAPALVDG